MIHWTNVLAAILIEVRLHWRAGVVAMLLGALAVLATYFLDTTTSLPSLAWGDDGSAPFLFGVGVAPLLCAMGMLAPSVVRRIRRIEFDTLMRECRPRLEVQSSDLDVQDVLVPDNADAKSTTWIEPEVASADTADAADMHMDAGIGLAPEVLNLFPSIEPSDDQPVELTTIVINVALAPEPAEHTAGRVEVPAEWTEFELDVLLLIGAEHRWDTLRYHQRQGTLQKAVFLVTVPKLDKLRESQPGDRQRLPVYCSFFYHNRWCGEGLRMLEVRQSDAVERLPAVVPPKKPPLYDKLVVEPGQEPDLTVTIKRDSTAPGWYVWTFKSPHALKPVTNGDCRSPLDDPLDFVASRMEVVAKSPEDRRVERMQGAFGAAIYGATSPAFRAIYWDLYHRAARPNDCRLDSIQFIVDEPYVPWELMRPAVGGGVKPEFLGIRHSVGRWVSALSCQYGQEVAVNEMAVFASDYAGTKLEKLPGALEEGEFLEKNYTAQPSPVAKQPILDFFRRCQVQVAHFACHGKAHVDDPDLSELLLVPEGELMPIDLDGLEENGIRAQRPLVFLNACELGASGKVLSVVGGWPKSFLQAGAVAFVGTLWAVNDKEAHVIGKEFYALALADPPLPLGEVMQRIRAKWKDRGLTRLAYLYYGDPNLRLRRLRSAPRSQ